MTIKIIDMDTVEWVETRTREVTKIEEFEVSVSETFVVVRLPIKMLEAFSDDSSYRDARCQGFSKELFRALLKFGINTMK